MKKTSSYESFGAVNTIASKEETKKMEKGKKKDGITLIALVVTIVVLLILAAVSITVLFGDNGIITMAQKAARETQEAADKDKEDLAKLDEYLTSGNWGGTTKPTDPEDPPKDPTKGPNGNTLVSLITKDATKNQKAEDIYGNLITIPAGFEVVPHGTDNVTYTYAEGENKNTPTVQDGIVIKDESGKQFVWIPVGTINNKSGEPTTITLGRYTFDEITGEEHLVQSIDQYKSNDDSISDLDYQKQYAILPTLSEMAYDDPSVELTEKINAEVAKNLGMLKSAVEASKGYFVSRVPFEGVALQSDASQNARKLSTSFFESDLMNSYCWDTAIVFTQNYSTYTRYSVMSVDDIEDFACNISPFGKNCSEWTTETCVHGNGLIRGTGSVGQYIHNSSRGTSYRAYCAPGPWPLDSAGDPLYRSILYCEPTE